MYQKALRAHGFYELCLRFRAAVAGAPPAGVNPY
jgi:hypothetical protein